MSENPQCANCFEEIPWTPVFDSGEVFCCDGCVMGGPCVCTYEGPAPRLNTRDILSAAGYDPEALASELTVCANCFEEFRRPPVYFGNTPFCCEGCVRGGPCTCTYGDDEFPVLSASIEGAFDDDEAETAEEGAFQKANRLWLYNGAAEFSENVTINGRIKANRLWAAFKDSSELTVQEVHDDFSFNFDAVSDLDIDLGLGDEESPMISDKRRVLVSPLPDVADVRGFTSLLERIPSVQDVMLTYYSGESATYEIESDALERVIKDLIKAEAFPIRNFSLTPDGLELTLRSKDSELLPVASGISSEPSDAMNHVNLTHGSTNGATARIGDDTELHSFKYEMGVDAFFNGRHQVQVGDVKGPVHMHSWRVQATLAGESVDETGSVVGTQDVKDIITAFVTKFNEKLLNKVTPFDEIIPTSNNIARVIFEHVAWELQTRESSGATALKSIRLWESPTSYVEYSGDGVRAH